MGQLISRRRAALDGLSRILEADAPEELFTGPPDDAAFLWILLTDVARARRSTHYWEICRTARRRGVTPEYVIDRAVVLLATIEERRRTDLYRILGIPALAAADTIRQRWLEVAKLHHPDVGGDGASFRRAKEAYEVLRDPARRVEYERFWLRALGPFERVARDDVPALEEATSALRARPRTAPHPVPEPEEPLPEPVFAAPDGGPLVGLPIAATLAQARAMLAPVTHAELDALRDEVARAITSFETLHDQLAAVAAAKRTLGV